MVRFLFQNKMLCLLNYFKYNTYTVKNVCRGR